MGLMEVAKCYTWVSPLDPAQRPPVIRHCLIGDLCLYWDNPFDGSRPVYAAAIVGAPYFPAYSVAAGDQYIALKPKHRDGGHLNNLKAMQWSLVIKAMHGS